MDRTIRPRSSVSPARIEPAANAPLPLNLPEPAIQKADSYQTQFLKLIPVEVLSAYITIEGLLRGSILFDKDPNLYAGLLWGVFIMLAILNPIYLRRVSNVRDWWQIGLSAGAFVIYILSLGGPFVLLPVDEAIVRLLGSILIPIYSLLALIILNK